MTKIITVTGISGSGSRGFCKNYSYNQKSLGGNRVDKFHTGDMIYELAQYYPKLPPIPKENILNLHPDILASLRDEAFKTIISNLEDISEPASRVLIDTHATFFWNNVYTNACDWKFLNQISTDLFITIIDKPSSIKENQEKSETGKSQNHDLRDLLLWQNIEVNVTQGWASNYGKPMYVFSGKQNPQVIDSLLYNSFLIYSSFPMTDAGGPATQKINEFKARLRALGKEINGLETPLIDPADIDVEGEEGLPAKIKDTIYTQTVHRDLNWDVAQSTHVVAYYPDEKTNLSKGVSDECTRAMETGKFVYVICPRKRISPFMEIAHQVFRDEEQFFTFFKKHMEDKLGNYKRK